MSVTPVDGGQRDLDSTKSDRFVLNFLDGYSNEVAHSSEPLMTALGKETWILRPLIPSPCILYFRIFVLSPLESRLDSTTRERVHDVTTAAGYYFRGLLYRVWQDTKT